MKRNAGGISDAIPGKYAITLHFIERNNAVGAAESSGAKTEDRTFDVFCNGKAILRKVNIRDRVGENRPLVVRVKGLEPSAEEVADGVCAGHAICDRARD